MGFAFEQAHRSQKIALKLQEQQSGRRNFNSVAPEDDKPKRHRRRRRQRKKNQPDSLMQNAGLFLALRVESRRVTMVNWDNKVVLDVLATGNSTLEDTTEKVRKLIHGKILVGHGLEVDLEALGINHPETDIRDTAKYRVFMHKIEGMELPRELSALCSQFLQRIGPRNILEEAIACLDLYKVLSESWEEELSLLARQKARQFEILLAMRKAKRNSMPAIVEEISTPVVDEKSDEPYKPLQVRSILDIRLENTWGSSYEPSSGPEDSFQMDSFREDSSAISDESTLSNDHNIPDVPIERNKTLHGSQDLETNGNLVSSNIWSENPGHVPRYRGLWLPSFPRRGKAHSSLPIRSPPGLEEKLPVSSSSHLLAMTDDEMSIHLPSELLSD